MCVCVCACVHVLELIWAVFASIVCRLQRYTAGSPRCAANWTGAHKCTQTHRNTQERARVEEEVLTHTHTHTHTHTCGVCFDSGFGPDCLQMVTARVLAVQLHMFRLDLSTQGLSLRSFFSPPHPRSPADVMFVIRLLTPVCMCVHVRAFIRGCLRV